MQNYCAYDLDIASHFFTMYVQFKLKSEFECNDNNETWVDNSCPKLEWGCPNGTKYPPRQPIPNRAILPNRARVYRQTDRQTDGQGDSSIPP